MLSILTPTGARPEAFAKCVEWMQAQDYAKPVRWVIVDDGPQAMPTPAIDGWEIVHLRPEPYWQAGQNTQARNILAGLNHVTDRVVIVEDDDQYAPWWLSQCDAWLDDDDLVGEGQSVYFNIRTKTEKKLTNGRHASLCQTALKGNAIEALRQVCKLHKSSIDVRLWSTYNGKLYPYNKGVVGLKGYPGRPGIGIGHRL